MRAQTSIRLPDTTTTLPATCPFSEASGQLSISTGKERDAESGNDYFGARYYASTMGRFLSPDPSMLETADPENPQSLNLYSYVLNNPLAFIDPDGMECVWDDGSFDSKDDKQTGSRKSCTKAGGTWIDPKAFATLNAGDWSDKANDNIAATARDLNSTSTTITVTAQDPGVVGAIPLETPQTPQEIDPIKQLAIGVNQQAGFALNWGNAIAGCAANHYILAPAAAATSLFGAPVPKALVFGKSMRMGGQASRFMSGAGAMDLGKGARFTGVAGEISRTVTGTVRVAGAVGRVSAVVALPLDAALIGNCVKDVVEGH